MELLTFFKEYYNVSDEQIVDCYTQMNDDTVILNGDLVMPREGFVYYPNLKVVLGNVYLNKMVTSIGIENLEYIIGSAFFYNLKVADGLENLKLISEDAFFDSLRNAKPIQHLDSIGGIGYFGSVRKDKYVKDIDIGEPHFPRIRKKNN